MKPIAFLGGILFFAGLGGARASCVDTRADASSAPEPRYRIQICGWVNRYRALAREVALKLDDNLNRMAQDYAREMFQRNFFGHVAPDGRDFVARLREHRIAFGYAGENIAYGYATPQDVMRGWWTSRGHRQNILNARFRRIGVGSYQNYWVQEFTD